MNETDIKKCIKNGRAYRAVGGAVFPVTRQAFGTMTAWWDTLHEPTVFADRHSAQDAIDLRIRDEPGTKPTIMSMKSEESPKVEEMEALSDAEFKKPVGRMSLPQLYEALKTNGVKLEGIGLEPKKAGNKYHRNIRGISEGSAVVDVYCVIEAFGVTCPARQHAIKKLLCAGLRGKGDTLQDLREAAESIERAIVMEKDRHHEKA